MSPGMAADAQAEADAGDRLLASRSPDESAAFVDAFKQGLGETGYVEGINIAVDYRWAEGDYDRLPELAADLVRRKVDVIMVAGGPPTALAAKDATSTIPIVFVIGTDPVELHLVASLARPGGNVTGVSIMFVELTSKRLELLSELVPEAASVPRRRMRSARRQRHCHPWRSGDHRARAGDRHDPNRFCRRFRPRRRRSGSKPRPPRWQHHRVQMTRALVREIRDPGLCIPTVVPEHPRGRVRGRSREH